MEFNFAEMNLADLLDLREKLNVEITSRQNHEKAEAKRQILELAKSYGLTIEEVLAAPKNPNKSKPVADKYKHPTDDSLRWSGRGRKPLWLQELLDSGKTLEELLIPVKDERQQELAV